MPLRLGEPSRPVWGNFSFAETCAIRLPYRLLKHSVQAVSGDESIMVFNGFRCEPEGAISDIIPPCHSDLAARIHTNRVVRPVWPTGNSGLFGIPGSVSRSPTEIQRTRLKLAWPETSTRRTCCAPAPQVLVARFRNQVNSPRSIEIIQRGYCGSTTPSLNARIVIEIRRPRYFLLFGTSCFQFRFVLYGIRIKLPTGNGKSTKPPP